MVIVTSGAKEASLASLLIIEMFVKRFLNICYQKMLVLKAGFLWKGCARLVRRLGQEVHVCTIFVDCVLLVLSSSFLG